jgi:ubiquinone/menaquinone biosynthesis C-methylase UbiE
MTNLHPLQRFSDRAQDYARYRPSYPEAAIRTILACQGSQGQSLAVADIGAGTGISARLMAAQGTRVIAIEPNQAMAQAATAHPGVAWQTGQAEATGLPSHSVDLVTCFQAFHWFQPDQALPEFHRILRPQGTLALIWNDRDPSEGFSQAYEALVQRMTGDNYLNSENRRSVAAVEASPLFGPFHHSTYRYVQTLDYDELIGRCRSSSYIPKTGPAYEELLTGLNQLFHQWQSDQGTVELLYVTHVYLSKRE